MNLKRVRKRPLRDPSLIIKYLEKHGVAYLRQIQVGLEDYMDHESCRHLIDELEREGVIKTIRRPEGGGAQRIIEIEGNSTSWRSNCG